MGVSKLIMLLKGNKCMSGNLPFCENAGHSVRNGGHFRLYMHSTNSL